MSAQWKMSNSRYEEIKQLILEMYEETGIDTCPIDPFEIARRLKYVVRPYSELSIDDWMWAESKSDEGFSRPELNPETGMYEYVIYYNDSEFDHTEGNIRWTIFHEIGHIYLGHHDNPLGNEEAEEDEANFFAKYAMCPPPLLHVTHCENALDVYNRFNTSDEFAGYAFAYYQTWLNRGPTDYLAYEVKLLALFHYCAA